MFEFQSQVMNLHAMDGGDNCPICDSIELIRRYRKGEKPNPAAESMIKALLFLDDALARSEREKECIEKVVKSQARASMRLRTDVENQKRELNQMLNAVRMAHTAGRRARKTDIPWELRDSILLELVCDTQHFLGPNVSD